MIEPSSCCFRFGLCAKAVNNHVPFASGVGDRFQNRNKGVVDKLYVRKNAMEGLGEKVGLLKLQQKVLRIE